MAGELTKVTKAFFDREKVQKALDKKTRRALVSFGANTRRVAQFSMRSPGKKANKKARAQGLKYASAPPGQPPFAHGDKLLRRFIFFSYEQTEKAVYVGPVLLDRTKNLHIPAVLEHGGEITEKVKGETVRKTIRPHPYMKPAAEKTAGSLTEVYKGKLT